MPSMGLNSEYKQKPKKELSQGLQINNKGFLCLIQDKGRFGAGHLGLSQGGAVDLHSYFWANKLLGNASNASVIEITMGGVSLTALQNVTLAITGANMAATIENSPVENWQSFHLMAGQTLNFDLAKQGLRTYIGIKNGFNTPYIFNSQATVIRNKLGGISKANKEIGTGLPLDNGDIIPVHCNCFDERINNQVPQQFQKHYSQHIKLDLIESYQAEYFSTKAKQTLYHNAYKVGLQSDRMGIQLNGEAIPVLETKQSEIISEGIAAGSVQIPKNGQPIILLNDRQTLGGYPKMGCISRLSQNRLAQARPDDIVSFNPIALETASKQWQQFIEFFK